MARSAREPLGGATYGGFTVKIYFSGTTRCHGSKSDLMFVVDGSGSIGAGNFERMKDFLKLIVDSVDVARGKTRVGLVQFSNRPVTEFSLNQHNNIDSLMSNFSCLLFFNSTHHSSNIMSLNKDELSG